LGGGWLVLLASVLVLAAGLLAPLRDKGLRRALAVSAALSIGVFLIWSVSWGSGMQTSPELATPAGWSISALRYLLPGIALAIISVALATRVSGAIGWLASLLLAVALIWSIAAAARFGSPWTPSLRTLAAGAVAGALAAAIALAIRRPGIRGARRPAWLSAGAAVAAAVVLGVLMVPVANGYIERSTKITGSTQPAPEMVAWFIDQPGFEEGDYPVWLASRAVMSSFAGDHFQHPLELVPARASCRSVKELARRRPLVVTTSEWFQGIIGVNPYSAPACLADSPPDYRRGDYTVLLPPD
jgi:peptidoglycan/LPS O-acetylase OafA/YrhL